MKTRKPAVANSFYAGTRSDLTEQISDCFRHPFGPGSIPRLATASRRQIVGIISPHAGYMYSGPVAANGYSRLAADGAPRTAIILGPNHTGHGSGVSMLTDGGWETPLGVLTIDSVAAEQVRESSSIIDVDESAHQYEHSIEVQLPFLQFLFDSSVKFVPICLMMQDLETSREIARAIVDQTRGRDCVIIASSDFTHYAAHDRATRKDRLAIDAIMNLDDSSLNALGETGEVTMCGYGPITSLIAVARMLGDVKTEFLTYRTSGDVTGDRSSVVGYASILITRQ